MDNAGGSLKAVVERVHSGQQQASISAQSIKSISEDISSASQANIEITKVTSDQLQRLDILHEQLESLIKIMQENALKAGTTAQVGKEFYEKAEALNRQLGQFKLDVDSLNSTGQTLKG